MISGVFGQNSGIPDDFGYIRQPFNGICLWLQFQTGQRLAARTTNRLESSHPVKGS